MQSGRKYWGTETLCSLEISLMVSNRDWTLNGLNKQGCLFLHFKRLRGTQSTLSIESKPPLSSLPPSLVHGFYPQCHFVAQDGAWSSSCVCGLFRKKAKVRGAYDFDAKSSFIISVKTHPINFIYLSLAAAVRKGTLEIQYFTWSCCCHQPYQRRRGEWIFSRQQCLPPQPRLYEFKRSFGETV